ncbi:MAG TPA: SRPBCC family protein [Candidatus Aquilonibacter sp.]|nr:SRPBCC family protein [Candidatus Aquilonibacter sp.]
MQRFRAEQWLPHPVEFVFAFFANPANLPRLMPHWQQPRIDEIELHPAPPKSTGAFPRPIAAGKGSRVTISFRPAPLSPVRLSWVALIENFHWDHRFCDRQIRGPFRYWRQCHSMHACQSERTGEHGTMVVDTIEYELPFGRIGQVTNRVAVRRLIASIFRYRHHRTTELLRELSAGGAHHE